MKVYEFTVPIVAQPQGSSSAYIVGGRAIVTSANKKLKPFRKTIAEYAAKAAAGIGPIEKHKRIHCYIHFNFERPKSVKRKYHVVKPDIDKLARGVFDALTGVLWHDDAQVDMLDCQKRYASNASVYIYVEEKCS
jgi:crossover junction endodeoxyribonuclease RusA